MFNILTSPAVVSGMELAIALCTGAAIMFLYLSIAGFLARRKKVAELTGVGGGFTLKKGMGDMWRSVRAALENANAPLTRGARYKEVEKILIQVNMETQYTRASFMLAEEAAAVSGFLVVFLLFGDVSFALAAGGLSFFMPLTILKSKLARKKYELLKAIPNALDILSAYIEGGLSLSASVIKYSERSKNVFAQELSVQVKKMQLGSTFAEAMKEMSRRLDTKEVNSVVNAFIQAETSGGSVRDIIKSQASEIRKRHFMALKQKAHEAPVKLLIPMIIFIFPVIFIVLFGPIVIKLMSGF